MPLNIQKGEIEVLVIPNDTYSRKIVQVVKEFSKNKTVCYINLNKMYEPLSKSLQQAGIDVSRFLFIDGVTMQTNSKPDESENCIYVSSGALTSLSLMINKILKTGKFDGLVFDSLSTLLIYNKSEAVCKFVHSIVTKIKSSGVTALFTALEGDTQSQLLKEVGMYVDSVEHMK